MGLFGHKQQSAKEPPLDETTDGVQRFFDGYFQDLKERGKAYFEETAEEQATIFKQDLDAAVARANAELKDHIAERLEALFVENNAVMKEAQEAATQSLDQSVQTFQEQYRQMNASLQKIVAHQEAILTKVFEETNTGIIAMKNAEKAAITSMSGSLQELEQQQQQLGELLQKNLAGQQAVLVDAFQENMARIIEHYLLEAVGDQYDLKAQLPVILKQMEANKEAIADDMKL